MRFFSSFKLGLLGLALLALAPISPQAHAALELPQAPNGYVLDQAQILSPETESALEIKLTQLQEQNSTQLVVVTVSSLQDYPIEQFALELGREWGVGQQEFNNGVVLLVAPNEREVRIEVGYGLEGAIPDLRASIIIEDIILPYFRLDDYNQGVLNGVTAISSLAAGEEFNLDELAPNPIFNSDPGGIGSMLLYLLPLIWALISWLSNTKSWWLGGVFGGLIGLIVSQALVGLMIGAGLGLGADFVLSKFFYKKIKHSSRYWGGGRGSGRGGGGFGGFGGGSFGGGGASGRW